jgi:hypothetical protein
MNQTITSTVEDAALTCTDSLGWTVKRGLAILSATVPSPGSLSAGGGELFRCNAGAATTRCACTAHPRTADPNRLAYSRR